LNLAGQAKLRADLTCDQFSHHPCGHPLKSVFARYLAGSSSYRIGENLAWGTGDDGTPRQTLSNWLNSPEHRANLLTPQFRDLGVGYLANQSFQGLQDATLWSQEFGTGGRVLERAGTRRR
ncbi:MAG TPA: CAP domain-containing protein, partial [Gaiellaceae bacterium]|nr:CAP domain-containing protein [Gaiellaceae bacterium]